MHTFRLITWRNPSRWGRVVQGTCECGQWITCPIYTEKSLLQDDITSLVERHREHAREAFALPTVATPLDRLLATHR